MQVSDKPKAATLQHRGFLVGEYFHSNDKVIVTGSKSGSITTLNLTLFYIKFSRMASTFFIFLT